MKKYIISLITFITISCNGQNPKPEFNDIEDNQEINEDSKSQNNLKFIKNLSELKLQRDTSNTYDQIRSSIEQLRQKLNQASISNDSISKIFKTSLLNRIIPFWEGTKWSFEGHTSKPQNGEIACGYFVSTTLKHVGLNLNRYKLAQQNPFNEAKSLSLKTEIFEISNNSINENIDSIKKLLKDGIHFIGFDQSHVGYILKEKNELYLIHSNYINSKGVQIEKIEESEVFSSYNRFFITELSTNKMLLKNWINGQKINVVTTK